MKDGTANTVKIFLAASLAINLVLLAPLIYRRFAPPSPPSPVKSTAPAQPRSDHRESSSPRSHHTPGIPEDQKNKIDTIMHEFRISLFSYKQDILEKRIAIIETLGDPDFNAETVTSKTKELNELENKLNLHFVETLMRVNAILEPEQRLQFLYRISRNWFDMEMSSPPHNEPRRHP